MKAFKKIITTVVLLILLLEWPLLARQIDLQDYFPHNVGDLWQYEDLNTSASTVPGFSSGKIFEIRITRVDTLEDGSRYVYVNNNYSPRWHIDSLYVYQMPSKLKIFTFAPDDLHSWWVTPHPDTTDFWRNYWRHVNYSENIDVLGRSLQVVDVSEWEFTDRGNTTNLFRRNRIEAYAHGIGQVSINDRYGQQWLLKGAIVGSDTLGTLIEMEKTDVFDWFPIQVGNRWQYIDTDDGELTEMKITQVDTLQNGNLEVYINSELSFLVNPTDATIHHALSDNSDMELSLMLNAGMREPWWQYEDNDHSRGDIWIQMTHSFAGDMFGHLLDFRVYNYFYSSHAGNYRSAIHDFDFGYAKGIGKIYEADYERILKYLVAAEIDGQIFGNLVSIDEDKTDIPGAFTLYQNYPNPFNPSTNIRYTLPEAGLVRLEVFDITGRSVALLRDQVMPSGSHLEIFDATMLSSGMYLFRLSQKGRIQVKKMMLLK